MHMPNDLSMKSLLESFDFHEKQHLNIKVIIPGTSLHKSYASVAGDSKEVNKLWTQMHKNHILHIDHLGFIGQNMYKCSNGPGQYTRTSVPVPSTCTKKENQVLFKEKQKKHKKCEISLKSGQNRRKIKRYTQKKNLIKILEQSCRQCHPEHLHNSFSIFGVFYDFI